MVNGIATDRLLEAETYAERQRKLAVKENHAPGRYDPGILMLRVC